MILMILFVVIVLILFISWIDLMKHRKGYNVRGPIPLPVLGNGLLFVVKTTEILSLVHRLSKKYGEAFLVYFLSAPYVILNHPRYIEPILMSSELITKGRAYTFLKPWLGDGLILSTGAHWKAHRRFLTPAFHFNILQTFLPIFSKNGKILTEKLDQLADGKAVDIFPIMAMAALDNVTEAIMGQCLDSQLNANSEYVKAITTATQILAIRSLVPIMSNDFVFNLTPYKKRQDDAIALMHKYTNTVVNTRRKELKEMNIYSLQENNDSGGDIFSETKIKHKFLDLLLLAEEDGHKFDEKDVQDEVETFMFAGQDTSTSGMAYTLYCISKHPHIQEKIYREQKSIFEDDVNRVPNNTDLSKMKYLELVIKESMRLYPPVPLIERMMTDDVEVGGVKMRKGTTTTLNIYNLQRHPDMYEDPLEFKPERFEAGAPDSKKPYYVFSAGPRNCIGQKFAMMEMKLTIAEIIKRFKILPAEPEPQICVDIVLRSINGVHVKFARR